MTYAKHVTKNKKTPIKRTRAPKIVPQTSPLPGSNQVENSQGGFSWAVDDWTRLERFLILGSEGGSYYASEKKLTQENAKAIINCLRSNGVRAVNKIVEISQSGRAPKNGPALFAMALAFNYGNNETKTLAVASLSKVARTGTDLFTFMEEAQTLRGWGRTLRKAVANWYLSDTPEDIAYQVCKYNQRNGWTHRDALRLSHPKTTNDLQNSLFNWIANQGEVEESPNIPIITSYNWLKAAKSTKEVVRLIQGNPSVSWEMIPSDYRGLYQG